MLLINRLWIIVWIALVVICRIIPASGEINPLPGVKNFTREEYRAASQNWSVCQDNKGIIYVANSIGLLEYDGGTWTLYPSPNGNVIRAVAADRDGRIYSSGYMELGYWSRNPFGKMEYTSLTSLADSMFKPNVEFWKISIFGSKVIFQAFTQLLIYEDGLITPVDFRYFVNSFFMVEGKMLFNVLNSGIYELRGTEQKPFLTGEFFRDIIVRFILPSGPEIYLIGTDSHGIFISDHGKITEWNTPLNDTFKKNRINRGCLTHSGDLLVGTILDGIYMVNPDGILIWKLNSENGLQNNTVLGMHQDKHGNIWLALDHGIDMVSFSGNTGITFYPVEKIGAVYSAALLSDSIYLGTNQGLFVGLMNGKRDDFRLIPGTQGQVWDVKIIGNHVIAGHNSGTFLISGGKATYISRVSGAFSMIRDTGEENAYLQCTYSNLVKYKLEKGLLKQTRVFYNFNELIRFIETDHLGNIWLGHMHRGLVQLRYNGKRDSVRIVHYHDPASIEEKTNNFRVFRINERVVFSTGTRLYTYDDLHDTIIPFNSLNQHLGKHAGATRIIGSGENHYWFISSGFIGLLKITQTEVSVLREYPRELFGSRLIYEYENIIPVTATTAILCLENGYAWLDGSVPSPECTFCENMPYPNEIYLTSQKGKNFSVALDTQPLKVPYNKNNLTVRWAFPHYSVEKLKYEWYMAGLSSDWTVLEGSQTVSYDRLPPGKYVLKGKVSDIWGHESREYAIQVEVFPPWYSSLTAKCFYIVIIGYLLILFRVVIVRKIKKAEQRKREENEKELITLKNEKLQSDITYKIKELASSTMMIIQKNKILTDLKELLQQQKNEHGNKLPGKRFNEMMRKIEETLSSHDDWKTFEVNFEQAHESFMKNLKSRYPDLTPKDIRLCAFLRMNLSSKEIAPLMGISVRGVENHRYRLRRKMNLLHDENLIEVILSL